MFKGPKFCTSGIQAQVPELVQHLLWTMIEQMSVQDKDYLQVFILSQIAEEEQLVIHTQEQPAYRKEHRLICAQQLQAKIYVIDDVTHCTMLLAQEY